MKLQLALLMLVSILLAGCGGPATSPTATPPPETPIAAMDFETGEAVGVQPTPEGDVAEPGETAVPAAVPDSGPAQE